MGADYITYPHVNCISKADERCVPFCPQRRLRTRVFLGETIPWWLAPAGYGGLAIVSTIFIPMLYTPVKWYYVLVAYIISPLFALPVSG
jgi:hypothetical protein